MTQTLNGKIIYVTGASRGAGAGIARSIIASGGKIILGYARNENAARNICDELGDGVIGCVKADFAHCDAPQTAWQDAQALAAGKITGLVLNHGIFEGVGLSDSYQDWQSNWSRTLQVNLQSAADLARLAAKDWVDKSINGTLIAISSRAAHRGDDGDHASYAASKAGLIAMVKTLARAYSGRGMIAFSIAPGWIDTEMAPQDREERAKALTEIPYGDMVKPNELGALCAFLLSGACNSATGATFDVNGASYVR